MFINLDQGNLIYTSPYLENNKHCIIVVRNTLLRDHVVQIKFLYFEMEESEDCVFDYLKIFSGERNGNYMCNVYILIQIVPHTKVVHQPIPS